MFGGLKRLLGLSISVRPAVSHDDLLRVIAWFSSGDTGNSSETLADHLTGAIAIKTAERYSNGKGRLERRHASYPHDNADLGRCIRFLRFMGWEHRAKEMRGVSPEWTALAKHWDELVKLYDLAEKMPAELRYSGPVYPSRSRRTSDEQWAKRMKHYRAKKAEYEKLPHCVLYNRMEAILEPAELKSRAAYKRRQERKEKTAVKKRKAA
jgi:hypothetical protein